MTHSPMRLALTLLSLVTPTLSSGAPQEATLEQVTPDYQVLLTDSDRQQITMAVMKDHPILAGSSGIKMAYASPGYRADESGRLDTILHAQVVFYPHAELRGVKIALQASCQRTVEDLQWDCPFVRERRYVRFDFQDYEVRLTGNLSIDGAAAIISATREPAAESAKATSEIADTALDIFEANGGYVVSWGSKDGMGRIGMEVHLKEGGNPVEAADWIVTPERVL